MRQSSSGIVRALIALGVTGLSSLGIAADAPTTQLKLDGHTFTLPQGFAIERYGA